jgi:hypothetical protein
MARAYSPFGGVNMKRHELDVLRSVLIEGGKRLQIDPSRSLKTIEERYEHEGKSFLSISLPAMHDDFIEALVAGRWLGSRLFGVKKGGPVFLRELLQLVFNFGAAGSHVKEGKTAVNAVVVIRQILLLYKKQKALPSAKRIEKAVDSFFDTERELRCRRKSIRNAWKREHERVNLILFGDLYSDVSEDIESHAYLFKHGPGSVAERSYGVRKYSVSRETWTKRLDKVLPYDVACFANHRHMMDSISTQQPLSPSDEHAMRVILVPKTQKTPRIIAADQTVNQFVQQGLHLSLLNRVKKDRVLRSSIDWTDQERQRKLALQGSIDGSVATLDLSEASDRVSVSLVASMLQHHRTLRDAVFACRTTKANFSGRTIFLEKFAPMGSALCFPFETMAFTVIVVESVLRAWGLPVTRRNVHRAIARVSLYGDDIIVPTETAIAVIEGLETFGLKVNARKSFWTGEFRESCGGDYFRGVDVTPVYLRYSLLDSNDPKSLAATISSQNQFFDKGWFDVSDYLTGLHKRLQKISVTRRESYRGFMFKGFEDKPLKYDKHLQCASFLAAEFTFRKRKLSDPDGWDQLMDWMISSERSLIPSSSSQTLERRPDIHHIRFIPTPAY